MRKEIEELIKAGCMKQLVGRKDSDEARTSITRDDEGKEIEAAEKTGEKGGEIKGRIHSIFGGFHGGGVTNSACKSYVHSMNAVYSNDWGSCGINQPDITFNVRDFEGVQPHEDDTIVVMPKIVDYDIERVVLDQGSSTDLIYGDAFEKLGLTESDLLPYDGALIVFFGENVFVRGYVELSTIFGEGKNAESFAIKILAVKCTSPYNVLIGRSSLNRLGAIISSRHLTTKYPLSKGGVGILKADQVVARKCYSVSFKQYGHMGKKVVKEGHRVYEVNIDQTGVNLDPRDGSYITR
ncbi:uncharacterized protein LOC130748833 [Lotus japonicus]|uniref:uncharacterized protein LOC130748833 n=1 Tax=Lotus japonicus TaxID=34305 RepID=UPI002589A446|nr:uncharacterized protein LOC130748833 [Lotus japonicus]